MVLNIQKLKKLLKKYIDMISNYLRIWDFKINKNDNIFFADKLQEELVIPLVNESIKIQKTRNNTSNQAFISLSNKGYDTINVIIDTEELALFTKVKSIIRKVAKINIWF